MQINVGGPLHFRGEAAGEVEAHVFIVPVARWSGEGGQGLRALLHEQLGHGPVHFALLNFMGEMKAIYYLMGARFHHGEGDGFDETASAHGAVDATGLGAQIIPVKNVDAHTPGGAAEGSQPVTMEAVDIGRAGPPRRRGGDEVEVGFAGLYAVFAGLVFEADFAADVGEFLLGQQADDDVGQGLGLEDAPVGA